MPTVFFALLLGCLTPPVPGQIAWPFVPPACAYCPGHRTVDWVASVGQSVIAPVDGRITFAGLVVNEVYVTIAPDRAAGLPADALITVGGLNLAIAGPKLGQSVRAGDFLGRATGLVRLSLRRTMPGGIVIYVDPGLYLGRLVSRPRLIPSDGTRGPVTPRYLQCPVRISPRQWPKVPILR